MAFNRSKKIFASHALWPSYITLAGFIATVATVIAVGGGRFTVALGVASASISVSYILELQRDRTSYRIVYETQDAHPRAVRSVSCTLPQCHCRKKQGPKSLQVDLFSGDAK